MTTTSDLATGSVLAGLRRSRAAALAADLEGFEGALEWCRLNEVADQWQAATWRETGQPLGGEGTPMIAEFSVVEFGAALGTSTDGARAYLSQTLELAHRLPTLFAGSWRARSRCGGPVGSPSTPSPSHPKPPATSTHRSPASPTRPVRW